MLLKLVYMMNLTILALMMAFDKPHAFKIGQRSLRQETLVSNTYRNLYDESHHPNICDDF
jgi:hypothetical protein